MVIVSPIIVDTNSITILPSICPDHEVEQLQVLTNSVIDRSVSILAAAMTIKTTMLVMVGSGKVHTLNDNNTKCIRICSRFSAS